MSGGGPEVLNGFVWWFVSGVYLLALALGVFVLIDSLLPKRRGRLAELPETRWLYTATQAVYLLIAVIPWFHLPASARWIAAVPVFATPVALGLQVAYLLRVVFPKPVATGAPTGDRDGAGTSDTDEARAAQG